MTTLDNCAALLRNVRTRVPLVHHLTNYVTVNDCANVTLAIGGSPIMATAIEEAADIAAVSAAVVLNIGTLNRDIIPSMIAAGKSANDKGIPVVFDPVGAGASRFRGDTTAKIFEEVKIAAVRGNVSEVRAASGLAAHTKGVDAGDPDRAVDVGAAAAGLASMAGCVVAVTGPVDAVSDGKTTILVDNGHPMLSGVSGTGCMCTSLVGSFAGANPDDIFHAALAGVLCMGVAGELAYENAGTRGLGAYRQGVMDAVSHMNGKTLSEMGKIRETDN